MLLMRMQKNLFIPIKITQKKIGYKDKEFTEQI
jgi:hypothetical protein